MRILIVRLSAMGDVLHAMPAVAAMRSVWPSAHIGWVVEQRWRPLLVADGFPLSGALRPERPLVNRVHLVDTKSWRKSLLGPSTWKGMRAALRDLRSENCDIAIDFQGTMKSALLMAACGAPQRVGFLRPREAPARLFYTRPVETSATHVVEQNMQLVSGLTHEVLRPAAVELPRDKSAERQCEAELSRLGLGEFALLSPGAGWPAKQWPAERFAEVARALARRGLRSLVNAGPEEEELGRVVAGKSEGSAVVFSPTLPELVSFTRRARLFVGGDTGPMHLAASLRVPVVALFGPTDPQRNGPFGTECVVLRSALSATSYSHRRRSDAGLESISSEQVIAAADALLSKTGAPR